MYARIVINFGKDCIIKKKKGNKIVSHNLLINNYSEPVSRKIIPSISYDIIYKYRYPQFSIRKGIGLMINVTEQNLLRNMLYFSRK